jgi:tetratricopeptide (TPR) repeat protein
MNLQNEEGRKELGRRIQAAVAHAGYTSLPAFSKALGCSRTLIYEYIAGNCLPPLDRLQAIAELTSHSLDWFISDDPNAAPGEVKLLEARVGELSDQCEELQDAVAVERAHRLADDRAARTSLLEALQELCRAQRQAGDMPGLMRSAARVEDVARSLENTMAFVIGRLQTGHAALGLGKRDLAEEALTMAVDLCSLKDFEEVGIAARQELVRLLQAAGRLDDARKQAAELCNCERWWPRWAAWVSLAALDEQAGLLDEAEKKLREAEVIIYGELAPEHYMLKAEVYVQSNRANMALARGDWPDAAHQAELLQVIASECEIPDQVREGMLNRAIVAVRMGEFERAQDLLKRLREWAAMAAEPRMAGLAAVFEAECLLRIGDAPGARRRAAQAIEMGSDLISGQIVAEGELVMGMAYLEDGLLEDAAHHLRRCRERSNRLQIRRLEVSAAVQQARTLLLTGDPGATEALGAALAAAEECGYQDLALLARQSLDGPDVAQITDANAAAGDG